MDDTTRRQFLDQFGHLITPQDTAARLERLFREGDFAQIAAILKQDDQHHIVPTTWREKKLTKPREGTLPRALLEESHALRKNPWGILFGDIAMDSQLIHETDSYEKLAPRALWIILKNAFSNCFMTKNTAMPTRSPQLTRNYGLAVLMRECG